MAGKHGASQGRSFATVAGVVAVGALAVLLGYAMGNYAITAVTTSRHRSASPSSPGPVTEQPASPAGAAPDAAGSSPAANQPPAEADRLLTRLEDGKGPAEPAVPTSGRVTPAALYRVQVGPFATRQEAVAASGRLLADGYPTYVTADRPYRVQVGAFAKRESAEKLVAELQAKRYANVRLVEP